VYAHCRRASAAQSAQSTLESLQKWKLALLDAAIARAVKPHPAPPCVQLPLGTFVLDVASASQVRPSVRV
jgi:hypothetical protein